MPIMTMGSDTFVSLTVPLLFMLAGWAESYMVLTVPAANGTPGHESRPRPARSPRPSRTRERAQ